VHGIFCEQFILTFWNQRKLPDERRFESTFPDVPLCGHSKSLSNPFSPNGHIELVGCAACKQRLMQIANEPCPNMLFIKKFNGRIPAI
jgi:hypothetical protein